MEINIAHSLTQKENTRFQLIQYINAIIEKEKSNAIGITIMLIMLGTGIASITAALAVQGEISLPVLMVSTVFAMGANATAISQQPFKTIVWAFILNITVNSLLLVYQIIGVLL